jgi:hypothetical protein
MKFKQAIYIHGRIRPILRDAKTNKIKWIGNWNHNIIPVVGLAALMRRLGNVASKVNEGQATYGAVGNGGATPNIADTQMQNEIDRKLIAGVSSVVAQTVHIETFFTEDEGNGALTKFALFGEDATAVANSGTMMEYADFDIAFTKTTSETLTVEIEITAS